MRSSWVAAANARPFHAKKRKKPKVATPQPARQKPARARRPKFHPFYSSPEWKKLRYEALILYGARCKCCGVTPEDGARLNVDHVKPRHAYPALALDIANLQVLCSWCNQGKGAWDQTDWRTW